MFLLQIVSSSLIWCLKITHACGGISLYRSLHWDWSSQPSKRTQAVDIFDFPMHQLSPVHWRRRPRLLKCQIRRFRAGSSFHYVLSPMVLVYQKCCLLRVCVQVSYKQLRPKTENKRKFPFPDSWKIFSFIQEHLSTFYFHFLYFLTFPAPNQIIRQARNPKLYHYA